MKFKQLLIMHIEDNNDHAELVETALVDAKVASRVLRFKDAESGVEYMTDHEKGQNADRYPLPDLILLDLTLPGMSGLEFLTYLRSSAVTIGIPVVVLTNTNDAGTIEKLYSCGANSYIVKPVRYEDFVIKLAELTMYWSGTVEVPGGSPKVAQEPAVLL